MSRIISSFALLTFLISMGGLADAKSCRDAKGKFMKCPTAVTKPMVSKPDAKGHCHGANGKFVKCLPK